jgi:hypothetical protein
VQYISSISTDSCNGFSIASISSAISQTHSACYGTTFGTDSRLSRAIRGGKNVSPHQTRQKGSFSIKLVDQYILDNFSGDLKDVPESLVRDVAVTLLHRLTFGRIGELRSFALEDVTLYTKKKTVLAHTDTNWFECDSIELRFYGTKNGAGARQQSEPIRIYMPRRDVIGDRLLRVLHPARWLMELKRRYHGRTLCTKDTMKAKAEDTLFGKGFMLNTTANKDGAFAPLASASYSSSIQRILCASGVTAKDGTDARAYIQRGTVESLLCDCAFPLQPILKQARHKEGVLAKSYYDLSVHDHVVAVFALRNSLATRLQPLRHSEAALCACKRILITEAAHAAYRDHSTTFRLRRSK